MKLFNHILIASLTLGLMSCSTVSDKMKAVGFESTRPATKVLTPRWIKNFDPAYFSGNLPIGLNSPLIHDGIVYAGSNQGSMQAFELENGRLIWKGDDVSQYHSGAVAYKDQIIYGTQEGRVISRHGLMGTIKYSVELGSSVESIGVINNGIIYFHLRNHQIMALDVETGKILWGYRRSVPNLTTLQRVSQPVVYKDKIIAGFADGSIVALSKEEGVVLYEIKISQYSKFMDVDNRVTIIQDKLYISGNGDVVHMLDPNTGASLRTSSFTVTREPLVRGENLYFGNIDGEIIVSDKNLTEISRYKVSKNSITNLLIYKNNFAVTTNGGDVLYVDSKTFKILESFDLGHAYSAVFGSAASTGDDLAIISSRNRLYFFK